MRAIGGTSQLNLFIQYLQIVDPLLNRIFFMKTNLHVGIDT